MVGGGCPEAWGGWCPACHPPEVSMSGQEERSSVPECDAAFDSHDQVRSVDVCATA